MDQRTFDTKVKELAAKLKDSGVAISDAQAKQMASDIISTERRAIKKQTQAVKEERIDVDTPPETPEQTAVPDEREQFQHDDPLVRRAVQQQQANQKTGGTDESIDQDRPIGELMAEADQQEAQPQAQQPRREQPVEDKQPSSTQPKVTLDNPVVDQGEQKKTLAGEDEAAQPGSGEISLDNPVVTQKRPADQQGAQPQKPVPSQPPQQNQQSPPAQQNQQQAQPAQNQQPAQPPQQNQQSPPAQQDQQQAQPAQNQQQPQGQQQEQSEKKESAEKKVDLSEMFNFSKRK